MNIEHIWSGFSEWDVSEKIKTSCQQVYKKYIVAIIQSSEKEIDIELNLNLWIDSFGDESLSKKTKEEVNAIREVTYNIYCNDANRRDRIRILSHMIENFDITIEEVLKYEELVKNSEYQEMRFLYNFKDIAKSYEDFEYMLKSFREYVTKYNLEQNAIYLSGKSVFFSKLAECNKNYNNDYKEYKLNLVSIDDFKEIVNFIKESDESFEKFKPLITKYCKYGLLNNPIPYIYFIQGKIKKMMTLDKSLINPYILMELEIPNEEIDDVLYGLQNYSSDFLKSLNRFSYFYNNDSGKIVKIADIIKNLPISLHKTVVEILKGNNFSFSLLTDISEFILTNKDVKDIEKIMTFSKYFKGNIKLMEEIVDNIYHGDQLNSMITNIDFLSPTLTLNELKTLKLNLFSKHLDLKLYQFKKDEGKYFSFNYLMEIAASLNELKDKDFKAYQFLLHCLELNRNAKKLSIKLDNEELKKIIKEVLKLNQYFFDAKDHLIAFYTFNIVKYITDVVSVQSVSKLFRGIFKFYNEYLNKSSEFTNGMLSFPYNLCEHFKYNMDADAHILLFGKYFLGDISQEEKNFLVSEMKNYDWDVLNNIGEVLE